jgi:endo-1,4-beta-D-glucanase Y
VRRRVALVAAGAVLVAVAALIVLAREGGDRAPPEPARDAAQRFLDGYLADDGRVVRRDQGGDTVSEGQAYAMLLAVALGDERRFDLAWTWARDHLRRPDGLLAWHWDDGQVVDGEPAADADLDAARALLLAGRRFGRADLAEEGGRLGDAIRAHEAVGDLVVAGPWARSEAVVNPSYLSPRAFDELGWAAATASTRRLIGALPGLPPDWARLEGDVVTPTGPPRSGEPPAYGHDAARVPLRLAESCAAEDRALAARAWPALRDRDPLPAVLTLDGSPRGGAGSHPVALVGAAGAARAAGDSAASADLLDRATALEAERPSYYGAAWIALARVMLDTPWLGGCGDRPSR